MGIVLKDGKIKMENPKTWLKNWWEKEWTVWNCIGIVGSEKKITTSNHFQWIDFHPSSCPWFSHGFHAPRYGSPCCPYHRHVSQCQRPSAHLLKHLQNGKKKWKHPQWPEWPTKNKSREKKKPCFHLMTPFAKNKVPFFAVRSAPADTWMNLDVSTKKLVGQYHV